MLLEFSSRVLEPVIYGQFKDVTFSRNTDKCPSLEQKHVLELNSTMKVKEVCSVLLCVCMLTTG